MIWKGRKNVTHVTRDLIAILQKHLHQMILELFILYRAQPDTIVSRVQKQNTSIHAQQEPMMTKEVRRLLMDVAHVMPESIAQVQG